MLKNIVYNAILKQGYEVSKSDTSLICNAIKVNKIDLVLDVGANKGQYSSEIRKYGYNGYIISFEPLEEAYKVLKKKSKKDKKWEIYRRAAVGNINGKIEMNVSGNSVSSSILNMKKTHTDIAVGSGYVGKEKVDIIKLDNIMDEIKDTYKNIFLKIDTQGYEWDVLDGATNILQIIKGLQCEVSLVELYEGQHLWHDVLNRIKSEGFEIWSIHKGFSDNKNGRTLQADVIFMRD
ncbi:MAG: FkbM family methyltransferase [Bacteroidetes bacterium]|nr:FkbM family methyltransferase [Bacteroidota bacterium]